MQQIDIGDWLRQTLVLSGCNDQQIGDFDGHSTIELEMVDLPAVYVGLVEGDIWFWSSIVESNPMLLSHRGQELLQFLFQGYSFARTGQMQLADDDGMLQVRVQLSQPVMESPPLAAEALDTYLQRLGELCDVIRG